MAKKQKVMDVVPNKSSKKKKSTRAKATTNKPGELKQAETVELGELVFSDPRESEKPMEVPVEVAAPKEEVKKQPKEEAKKPKQSMKRPLPIIHILATLAAAISVGVLIFNISRSNLLPAKFFYPIIAVLIVLMLVFLRLAFRKKTKTATRVVLSILSLLVFGDSLFANLKLGDTLAFLDQNLNGASYQTITYDVVTGVDSRYEKAEDLSGTTVTAPPDFAISEDELGRETKDQLGANLTISDNIDTVTNLPLQDSDALILLSDSIYASILETSSDYGSKTKIIATVKITKRIEKDNDNGDLGGKPFLLFLSGIDARSGNIEYTSLSDVNMVIAVNPKTAQILLLTVPRDYYVQLPGTTGLKDKLTHAGMLGGAQLSKSTIEDLLGIKFDDYVRVSFNFVVGLVDTIGGIEIYSDWNTPITCYTDRSCVIQPGNNYVDGRCALAFSRERMAYNTGDTHRGENQQQVIEKIFSKLSHSSTLINNYSSILSSLNGTFETSLTSDDISSLVRLQLDSFPQWKIHTYTLGGTAGMDYTYSYPSQLLYVTYPDETSIAKAKQMIQDVLNGN